jgi:hypothetical protein
VRARLHRPRGLAIRGLHLFVLSAFAIAQPLFDLLSDTPEFFVVRGSTGWDIVALGLGLILLPPVMLLAVEALAGVVSDRAAGALHLVFLGALAVLVVLQGLKKVADLSTPAAFAVAVAIAALGVAAYARTSALRTFLTVLAPAPVVFLLLFLANSPIEKLSLENEAQAQATPIASTTPVVVIVFDELPISSLMDANGKIDPVRYPSFAALARDATWFRNAATVHEHTTEAVPAIMTGTDPQTGRLPLLRDHPDNLFTFLGGSYAMHVWEPVTQLCPSDLCPRQRDSFAERMASLSHDLTIVYGHVVLPKQMERRIPSVTETWQDFGKQHEEGGGGTNLAVRNDADIDQAVGRQLWQDQRFQSERFVEGIEPSPKPTLHFLHAMLPHSPWRFLPDGKQYGDALGIDGLADDKWGKDEWLVAQGWQRHLLQTGLVDRVLGDVIARLKKTGLYDKSLVIVTADHGVSFRAGDRRRGITETNIGDIAPVPLLVKKPNQHTAVIEDRHVRTTDIVPTIADVLGAKLPYAADGRSLFDPAEDRDDVEVHQRAGDPVSASAGEVERLRDETVARKVALFGSGSSDGLYAFGPDKGLVGKRPVAFAVAPANGLGADVDGSTLLADVDPASALAPTHVSGHLSGDTAEPGIHLAVAVNGRIAGTTQSFHSGSATAFSAYLPESAFRAGANDVEILRIDRAGDRVSLAPLGSSAASGFELASENGRDTIRLADGTELPVTAGAVDGMVEDWFFEPDSVRFGGWAGDTARHVPADRVLVFAGDDLLYAGTPGVGRADLAKRWKGLGRSGFVFDLPRSKVGEDSGTTTLRFFALRGNRASELAYARDFPWRP